MRLAVPHAFALASLLSFAACNSQPAPSQQPVDTTDPDEGLPEPDGKADGAPFGDLLKRVDDLVGNFSACNGAAYYATADAGIAEIARRMRAAGTEPNDGFYVVYVGRFNLPFNNWQHSEIRIPGALGLHNEIIHLDLRTVGDGRGAGLYQDLRLTHRVGPRMCLTWTQLQQLIRATYLPGVYGLDYVCHTASHRGLEAAGISPEYFEGQFGGWRLARWVFGPWLGSGIPTDPNQWNASCENRTSVVAQSGLAP